jgi:hypothetical protein
VPQRGQFVRAGESGNPQFEHLIVINLGVESHGLGLGEEKVLLLMIPNLHNNI